MAWKDKSNNYSVDERLFLERRIQTAVLCLRHLVSWRAAIKHWGGDEYLSPLSNIVLLCLGSSLTLYALKC